MIRITINGKEVKLEKPVTVLEAARSAGIKIPTLCWHEQLEKYGGCRLCLVEVEKMPRLQTACTLMAADGMVVKTETAAIADVRRGILEFLLINHPLDCPYCDKAGECELQDLVEKYGPTTGRFGEKKRKVPENLSDPIIVRNMSRCVMCTRCVRMCDGIQGASAIAVIDRGGHSHIEPFSGGVYDCEYCGNCLSVCPVGAIMSKLHRHSYRPWQLSGEIETICPYCGVGCTVVAQVRDDSIKRVVPRFGKGINNGMLCSRGRFGYEFVGSKDRLSTPMIRKNGVLEEATWEEAIVYVAKRLSEIKGSHGSDAIAGIASPRCTNEDNYAFQKFFRAAIGTNNIDSTARMGYAGAQALIEGLFGQGSTANIISGLANSDMVFIAGGDPTSVNPILGLQIRACSRRGGNILTIGKVRGVENFTPLSLNPFSNTDSILLEGIVTELKARKGASGANPAIESGIGKINTSASEVEKACGISQGEFGRFIDALASAANPGVVLGRDMVQSAGGNHKLLLLAAINYLINGRIYLLSEKANEQGVLDIGCTPDLLPGSRPVFYPEFRKKCEGIWKTTLPDKPGLSIFGMMEAAENRSLKALYVMGENPVFNMPDSKRTETALGKLDLLVVQDIFLTETARLAHVVLPALSWAEKDGTFTNMERRIQRVRKAVERQGMEDWKIICEISKTMGYKMKYSSPEDIFTEISRVSPLHRDLTYEDIEAGDAIYPYKGEPLRGVPGEVSFERPVAQTGDGKMYLRLERPLFHSGTLSRRAPALTNIYPEAVARISPRTALSLSLKDGDMVRVSTSKGSMELPVAIDACSDDSMVYLTNNFEGKGAFSLASYTPDPVTKAPCLDAIQISIEKVSR